MTKREFQLSVLIILVLGAVAGPIGYYAYTAKKEQYQKEIQLEKEVTERTKERWNKADEMLQRLPFMKKDDKSN